MILSRLTSPNVKAPESQEVQLPQMPPILLALSCGPNVACFRIADALIGTKDIEFAYQIQTPTGAK